MVLRNARIYTPFEEIYRGYVRIEGGKILDLGREPASSAQVCVEEDLEGMIVGPGFIDTHIHGAHGFDVMEGSREAILEISKALARHGVTSFIPTSVTASQEDLLRVSRAVCNAMRAQKGHLNGSRILGLHMEGPYINPRRAGAHDVSYIRKPDLEEVLEIISLCGGLRGITLAPEIEGALDLVKSLSEKGVTVQAGHSNATYEETLRAIYVGVSKATHLYNAMREIHHREPGIAVALLESPQVYLELIADMIHVSPAMLRLAVRYAGVERIALVSDAIAASGLGDGIYHLGRLRVRVERGVAKLEGSDVIAGSTILLDKAFKNMASLGYKVAEIFMMSSTAPARSAGADRVERIGILRPGYTADLVILDRSLQVVTTIIGGRIIYKDKDFNKFLSL